MKTTTSPKLKRRKETKNRRLSRARAGELFNGISTSFPVKHRVNAMELREKHRQVLVRAFLSMIADRSIPYNGARSCNLAHRTLRARRQRVARVN